MSVPSKKATGSRNQRLFLRWIRVSKKQYYYRIERVVEHNEYGIGVAREGSTPIGQWPQLHLKTIKSNHRNHIWNILWSWIIHLTVLYWHLNWRGRTHPPYCFSVKWKPTKRWKMDESGFEKKWSVKSAHPESIAYDHVEGNACLKKCLTLN